MTEITFDAGPESDSIQHAVYRQSDSDSQPTQVMLSVAGVFGMSAARMSEGVSVPMIVPGTVVMIVVVIQGIQDFQFVGLGEVRLGGRRLGAVLVKVKGPEHEEHQDETDRHPEDGCVDVACCEDRMGEHDEERDPEHESRDEGHHHLRPRVGQSHEHREISSRQRGRQDEQGIDDEGDD